MKGKLAFALFHYFPFGGLQRNFLSIARACRKQGYDVDLYAGGWDGPTPDGFDVYHVERKGLTNNAKDRSFYLSFKEMLSGKEYSAIVGFNRMPGLDVYYAADTCFAHKAREERGFLYRLTKRYREYMAFEKAVYGLESKADVLLVAEQQKEHFQKYYGTPESRFHTLPPGISRDRMAPDNAEEIRREFREEFGLKEDDNLILMVGSGFKTKGLDRALEAVGSLPGDILSRTRLHVVGKGKPERYSPLIEQLELTETVRFLSGRSDVTRFMLGADLLVHPAYLENTGNVILEAIVAGLPVLATENCGYAHYVVQAEAGLVAETPFDQGQLNGRLLEALTSGKREGWRKNGVAFGRAEDLYGRPEFAAKVIDERVQRNREN